VPLDVPISRRTETLSCFDYSVHHIFNEWFTACLPREPARGRMS
jgi:hypothetical protein